MTPRTEASKRGHVLQIFQPASGGVPAYVAGLAEGLIQRGWEVTVAGPPRNASSARLRASGARLVPLELPRSFRPLSDARGVREVARLCRSLNVDIVHGHSTKAGLVSAVAARLAGRPSVFSPNGWSFEMRVPLAVRAGLAAMEHALVRRFHRTVLAVAGPERDAALWWHVARPPEIRVVHTGLPPRRPLPDADAARTALGLPQGAFVAAWVGRDAPQKRPQDLAPLSRAVAGDGVVLVALGVGLRQGEHGRALAAAGGVVVPEDTDVGLVLAAADVFVQTSAWEGLPLTILEAMAAGLPVVAYDVGGVSDQVEHGVTGWLAEAGDLPTIAACLRDLARMPGRVEATGTAGREMLDAKFSFEGMIDGIEGVYLEAAGFRLATPGMEGSTLQTTELERAA